MIFGPQQDEVKVRLSKLSKEVSNRKLLILQAIMQDIKYKFCVFLNFYCANFVLANISRKKIKITHN